MFKTFSAIALVATLTIGGTVAAQAQNRETAPAVDQKY